MPQRRFRITGWDGNGLGCAWEDWQYYPNELTKNRTPNSRIELGTHGANTAQKRLNQRTAAQIWLL